MDSEKELPILIGSVYLYFESKFALFVFDEDIAWVIGASLSLPSLVISFKTLSSRVVVFVSQNGSISVSDRLFVMSQARLVHWQVSTQESDG